MAVEILETMMDTTTVVFSTTHFKGECQNNNLSLQGFASSNEAFSHAARLRTLSSSVQARVVHRLSRVDGPLVAAALLRSCRSSKHVTDASRSAAGQGVVIHGVHSRSRGNHTGSCRTSRNRSAYTTLTGLVSTATGKCSNLQ